MHPPPARPARLPRPDAPGPAARHHPPRLTGRSARAAAAAVDTSGPGLTGSSRNTRAGVRHPAAGTTARTPPRPTARWSRCRRHSAVPPAAPPHRPAPPPGPPPSAPDRPSAAPRQSAAPAAARRTARPAVPQLQDRALIRSSSGRAARSAPSSSATAARSSRTVTSSSRAPSPASVCREVTITRCGPRPRQQRPHLRLRRRVIRDHQHRTG